MSVGALRAPGLLGELTAAGVLAAADAHVAIRLARLTGETDERVLLAIALTVRSTRLGSVVLDLATVDETVTPDADDAEAAPFEVVWPEVDGWVAACAASPVAADGPGGATVRMVGSRLWLDRYWRQETVVADDVLRRRADPPAQRPDPAVLDALFPEDADADQRAATALAAGARISVIVGGPGTGKTTTVARLIAALWRVDPTLRVALAAPTAKAADRVEQSVQAQRDVEPRLADLRASTLHRLLGWRPGSSSRFKHDAGNRLPYDVVVVDESSMVSLTMMARLIEALPPAARLVLVGDPDQLASVEAGAVLGDLVEGAGESVAMLRTVRRFDAGGPIARLAQLVRVGDADGALALLRAAPDGLVWHEVDDEGPLTDAALAAVRTHEAHERRVIAAARDGDAAGALALLDERRLLCAHRSGPRGVREWSERIERRLVAADPLLTPRLDGHYAGQPLRVTVNDYANKLWNSDVGVVVEAGDELAAAFRGAGGEARVLKLVQLPDVVPMHAATVHNAQGSQFRHVTVLLPLASSPLATRQTFYTGITRASESVQIIGSEAAVRACIERRAARATGLRDRLRGELGGGSGGRLD